MPRDEDDEDERPRRKRRDEDDEDRPRRRKRRDEDEDDFDGYDDEPRRERLSRETLRGVAGNQKAIILCILVYLCLIPAQFAIPEEFRNFVALALIPLGLTATVFVFLLATKVYTTATGVILGILTLVPCVGLIVLLIINGKATGILKANGIHVGFFGASASDI